MMSGQDRNYGGVVKNKFLRDLRKIRIKLARSQEVCSIDWKRSLQRHGFQNLEYKVSRLKWKLWKISGWEGAQGC